MKNQILAASLIIAFGVLTRTTLHLGENIEFVTALALASGYFFSSKKFGYLVPLSIMILSDALIGNSIIFLFTWSAMLLPGFLARLMKRFDTKNIFGKLLSSQLFASLSVIFFFLWTNFGVVITSNMYTNNLSGLIQSYINALPFLGNQLGANLIITPIIFSIGFAIQYLTNLNTSSTKEVITN